MKMHCPQCHVILENALECPDCGVRLTAGSEPAKEGALVDFAGSDAHRWRERLERANPTAPVAERKRGWGVLLALVGVAVAAAVGVTLVLLTRAH